MTWRAIAAALLVGGSLLPVSAASADDSGVFAFHDPRIAESSGLVDLGSVMVTTNDSGHPSKLFVVSPATGRTVGVTDFHAPTVDVEALAPAGPLTVWVGDIGDNEARRKSLSVYRVTVGLGVRNVRAAHFRLAYPHVAHDAESLFADRQGRLYVVTKSFLGGTVYRAPLPLSPSRVNRLQPIGHVAEFASDAALLPDGRHFLVRGPERAGVYTLPGFRRIGGVVLPPQRQGEGLSVGPGGRIRLSSEGVRSVVRTVALPAALARSVRPPAPAPAVSPPPSVSASPSASPSAASASPSASPSASGTTTATAGPRRGQGTGGSPVRDDPWLMWSIPGVIILGAVGIGLGLRRRSE